MNYVVPDKTQVRFQTGVYIENTPINLSEVITFEKDIFVGIEYEVDNTENDDVLIGAGNNMPTNDSLNKSVSSASVILVGRGRPAITFKYGGNLNEFVQWCFLTKPDRDNHYDQLVEFVSKESKMVIKPR
jgi:hypothetical protein